MLAGTGRQLTLVMVNTNMVFRSPKYYQELQKYRREKELRERNKLDQVISNAEATAASERAPGPGLKQRRLTKREERIGWITRGHE